MKIKHLSYVLFMTLIVGVMLMITGCGLFQSLMHEHSYSSTSYAPGCTTKGYTKYTCSCGESYTNNYVNATGHDLVQKEGKDATCTEAGYKEFQACTKCSYTSEKEEIPATGHAYAWKIVTYPGWETDGLRRQVCKACDYSLEEKIDCFKVNLPEVSAMLKEYVGDAKYTLEGDDADFAIHYLCDGTEYESEIISIKLADFLLDGTGDTLLAHLKLELSMTPVENGIEGEAEEAAIYIYVNGDVMSIEAVSVDGENYEQELSLNDMGYSTLFEMMGLDPDEYAKGNYVMSEAEKLVPIITGFMEKIPALSEEALAELEEIFALVGEGIITEEVVGDNTVYTLQLSALQQFLDLVEGKTVAEILDDAYGEGAADAIAAFVEKLPNRTIGEIADAAIAFSEGYEVPVEEIYYVINLILAEMDPASEIDIEELIETYYDTTLFEIMMQDEEMTESELASAKAEFEEMLSSSVEMILDNTLDEILVEFGIAEENVFEVIRSVCDGLDEIVFVEYTKNAEGKLVGVKIEVASEAGDFYFAADENGYEIRLENEEEIVFKQSVLISEMADQTLVEIDLWDGVEQIFDGDITIRESGDIYAQALFYAWDNEAEAYGYAGQVSVDIVDTEGGKVLSYYVYDETYYLTASGEISVSVIEEDNKKTIEVWSSMTSEDGTTVNVFNTIAITTLEDGVVSYEYAIRAEADGVETVAIYCTLTVSEDAVSVDARLVSEGDTKADFEFSLEQENDSIIASYDIKKIIINSFMEEADGAETLWEDFLSGSGRFILSVVR